MRWFAFIAVILVAASPPTGAARAAGGLECVKTQCEGNGGSCVKALYVAYDACAESQKSVCNSKRSSSERRECITWGLNQCKLDRDRETFACLTQFRSCYQTCGPLDGRRADYWCVAYMEADKRGVAAFCAADPDSSKPMDQCEKLFGRFAVSRSCAPL
jgi:hypothetical protein